MTRRPNLIPESCGGCLYLTRTGVVQGRCRFYGVIRFSASACLAGPEEKVAVGEEPAEPCSTEVLAAPKEAAPPQQPCGTELGREVVSSEAPPQSGATRIAISCVFALLGLLGMAADPLSGIVDKVVAAYIGWSWFWGLVLLYPAFLRRIKSEIPMIQGWAFLYYGAIYVCLSLPVGALGGGIYRFTEDLLALRKKHATQANFSRRTRTDRIRSFVLGLWDQGTHRGRSFVLGVWDKGGDL